VARSTTQPKLYWQSKLVLLLVFPCLGADVVLKIRWWAVNLPAVALWTLGLSVLLGLVAWKLRSATPWAAACGALVAASITFATTFLRDEDYGRVFPYRTALVPLLLLLVLTSLATRLGRSRKERLGTAETRHGRSPSQVAANLGIAALVSNQAVLFWLEGLGLIQLSFLHVHGMRGAFWSATLPFVLGLAALAESAADTVSSEIGQVLGGRPRMLTTMRRVEPGTDGAISLAGTLAGISAGAAVSLAGAWALSGGWEMFLIACAGGVFGLFFDSLLGATLERRGWLNNDGVNFLSTACAAAFALGLLALVSHHGMG
jgi:uncharacterized protein (TIGR00297 family)